MSASLSETERYLNNLRSDLWQYHAQEVDLDSILRKISLLATQLEIQKELQATATSLRRHASDAPLPQKLASRAKHFLKFVFEQTDQEKEKEKQTQLRMLPPDVLIFCGLSFKVKKIYGMPSGQFDFLVANLADFIQRQQIADYLYRNDIDKAVHSSLKPEDINSFIAFKKSMPTCSI
jgi:hypothetical protein